LEGIDFSPYHEISKQLKVTKQTLKYCTMKNAMMVATLCATFISQAMCQEIIYKEWLFTNEQVDSVMIFKAPVKTNEGIDWYDYFESPKGVQMEKVHAMPNTDKMFFEVKNHGVYAIVGWSEQNGYTSQTYVIIDDEYIKAMKQEGWAKTIDGVLSSKKSPLRFARGRNEFVSARSMLEHSENQAL